MENLEEDPWKSSELSTRSTWVVPATMNEQDFHRSMWKTKNPLMKPIERGLKREIQGMRVVGKCVKPVETCVMTESVPS